MSDFQFARQVNQIRASSDQELLNHFYFKMASRMCRLNALSKIVGHNINELDSEYGFCPCGKGIVLVDLQRGLDDYGRSFPRVVVICSTCQKLAYHLEYLKPKLAIDPDLTVDFEDVNFKTILHSRGMWKMLAK